MKENSNNAIRKPRRTFWLINCVGWIAVTFINIVFQTHYFSQNFDAIGYSFVITVFSFSFTFLIRYVILKLQINEKPIKELVPRLALLTIISGAICVFTFSALIILIFPKQTFSIGETVNNLFQFSLLILVWILLYGSFLFFENQQKLTEQKLTLSLQLKDAELNNLRKQLSPHFLFNSLNNIHALIRINPEKARDAVLNISDLLRYVLNYQKTNTVSLQEEMEIVNIYVQLNTIHLEENVRFEIETSPSLSKFMIPPLSVQLLVENAIKHGTINDGALVSIRAYESNGARIIEVQNPGKLNQKGNEGIGINNLIHRFKVIYGESAQFQIYETNQIVTSKITVS